MAPRAFVLFAACGAYGAGALNLVNRKSGMCLDLHAPCLDGSTDEGCQRVGFEHLKKGTNLQLFKCHGKKNQEFELTTNGRIRNPLTDLCLDIMAPCKDHMRTPCERVAVTELKEKANVQLYTCHEDAGVLSNSYGNQKWNFQAGQLRNWLSNLCLEPMLDSEGNMVPMANIHADTCEEDPYQKFDMLDGTSFLPNTNATAKLQQKFNLLSGAPHLQAKAVFNEHFLRAQNDTQTQALVAGGFLALVAAAVTVGLRARRQQFGQGQHVLVADVE